jgi:hypothetical protein
LQVTSQVPEAPQAQGLVPLSSLEPQVVVAPPLLEDEEELELELDEPCELLPDELPVLLPPSAPELPPQAAKVARVASVRIVRIVWSPSSRKALCRK